MIGLDYFCKVFPRDSKLVIFDAGSHHGESIKECLDLFPESHVYAFEADRENYQVAHSRFSKDPRVTINNFAIGAVGGEVELYKNNYSATHSLLPFDESVINRWADANDFVQTQVVKVEQVAIDDFCRCEGIAEIDILKMDIQGGELMAIQGAHAMLASQNIKCIFSEVEFRPLYKDQPLFWEISNRLREYQYHFVNIISPKVSEMGVLCWADAVYVNDKVWKLLEEKHSAGKKVA